MSKLLVSAVLVGGAVLAMSSDASARCRRYRYWAPSYRYYYSAPAGTGTAAPAVVQRNGAGYSYRSFSYDSAPAAVYVPQNGTVYQPLAPSQSHFFRADRKAHSLSWYRTE